MRECQFPIEADVPLPIYGTRYPFADLKIGESFLVPREIVKSGTVSSAACAYKQAHPGWNYTTRAVAEGCRLWRIA